MSCRSFQINVSGGATFISFSIQGTMGLSGLRDAFKRGRSDDCVAKGASGDGGVLEGGCSRVLVHRIYRENGGDILRRGVVIVVIASVSGSLPRVSFVKQLSTPLEHTAASASSERCGLRGCFYVCECCCYANMRTRKQIDLNQRQR
eukprot:GFYU01000532.1.p2 GENE.GFYU01000532.1~~GFYU01000532.1.p2  ORF type:complete len:147 (-),score=9.88 GFYU01000532.1:55-495(-)